MIDEIKFFKTILFNNDIECLFNNDELISIALSYPSLLVATCDGVFDKNEKIFMATVARELGDKEINNDDDELKYLERYACFVKLLELDVKTKDKILDILSEFCSQDPSLGIAIYNSMIGIAETSSGISTEEHKTINHLKLKLGISIN